MKLGLAELRLPPKTLWDMTPAEMMVMAGLDPRDLMSAGRDWFDLLQSRFPDAPSPAQSSQTKEAPDA